MIPLRVLEAIAAVWGLVGSFVLATQRPWSKYGWWAFLASNIGWIAFAWRLEHWGLLIQQIGFTVTSLIGIWRWHLRYHFYWGEWCGDVDGTNPVMLIMRLASWRGFRLDLHKMVGMDSPGCYHTHPAKALRVILWCGYTEEVEAPPAWTSIRGAEIPGGQPIFRVWKPGMVGIVRPELSHRVAFINGKASYSLWLRWPKTHEVQLRGPGWPADMRQEG